MVAIAVVIAARPPAPALCAPPADPPSPPRPLRRHLTAGPRRHAAVGCPNSAQACSSPTAHTAAEATLRSPSRALAVAPLFNPLLAKTSSIDLNGRSGRF